MSLDTRLGMLTDAHPWMEPQLQVALAQSNNSDSGILGIADSMKQTLISTWDGWQSAFDDPVLQKRETAGLALRRYMTQAIGPWPVADTDLLHMQRELASRGFGAGLDVNGAWDQQWNAAYNDYLAKYNEAALAGNSPGSVPATSLLHGALNAITPAGLANHLIGFAKALPGQGRNLLADLAHAGTTLGAIPVNAVGQAVSGGGQMEGLRRSLRAGATAGAAVETALGNEQTPAEYFGDFQHPGRIVDDVGNLFLIAGAFQAGTRIALAAGEAAGKGLLADLGEQAAVRGPGVVAKTVARPIGQRIVVGGVAGAGVGAVHAKATGGDVLSQALGGAVAGAAIGVSPVGKWALNLPVLSKAGPWVAKAADADSLYYKTRTLLAQPYRLAGVQAAGDIAGELQAQAIKTSIVAGASGAVSGGKDPLAKQVFGEHALDPVDAAIRNRLSVTAFGHRFSVGINDLALALHPTVGHGAGTVIEHDAATVADHVQGALGRVGIQGQIERGMDGLTFDDLARLAGNNPPRAAKWLAYKVREMAAWHYGELAVRERGLTPYSREWMTAVRDESGRAWRDPDVLDAAVTSLANQPGEIETRLRREITHSALSPDRFARHQLTDFLDAGDATRALLRDHRDFLITPDLAERATALAHEAAFPGTPAELSLTERIREFGDRLEQPAAGRVGLASKDTLDGQQAAVQLARMRAAYDAATSDEARQKITAELLGWMHGNFNTDARTLGGLGDTDALFRWAGNHSKELAHPVYPTADAPAEVTRLLAKIDKAGYKVVHGTDIGHFYEDGLPDLHVLDGRIGRLRRVLERAGVTPEMTANTTVGNARYSAIRRRIQRLVDGGDVRLPPYYTVDTLMADLADDNLLADALPWSESVAFGAGKVLHRRAAAQLARRAGQTVEGLNPRDVAMAQIEKELATGLNLRDIPRKKVLDVLTRTERVPWVSQAGDDVPLMDVESANRIYRALVRGAADTPARMVGWTHVEDLFRASTGFLGGVIPGQTGEALANLPNRLIQARNRLRFELNPEFQLRRVAKTNVKLATEGVAPTWRPLDRMVEDGTYDRAHAYLDRVAPRSGVANLVDSERYLHASDLFGIYSQRQYEAYAAWAWRQAGKSDDEVRRLLVRTFAYGTGGTAGRSALERSTNFVFFPFSFEKTLYRNVGGYLLDHPAQLIMATRGLAAYHEFNETHMDGSNPLAASWWQRHVPVLKEALRLNAFAHGLSAGEVGGLNLPLLNAFLPQSWESSARAKHTVEGFVPAVKELQRIWKEAPEQVSIAFNAGRNSLDTTARWLERRPRGPLDPQPRVGTREALLADAFTMRRQLVDQLRPALDYNARHGDTNDKYRFPDDPSFGALAGEVVNRENVGWIVHRWYPAFNPAGAAEFAIARDNQLKGWLLGLKETDPARYGVYSRFFDSAKKAAGYMGNDEYTTEQAAELTSQFRQAAVILAGENAEFLRRYNLHLRPFFGPVEKLR